MQIYLAKPGGQKEGPFTLEQIQRDIAAGRIRDNDFWAWHEGLPQWMPLYEVPGIAARLAASRSAATARAPIVAAPRQPERIAQIITPEPEPAAEPEPVLEREPEPEPETVAAEEPRAIASAEFSPEPAEFTSASEEIQGAVETSSDPAEQPQAAVEEFVAAEAEPTATEESEETVDAVEAANPADSSGFPFSALEQIFIFTSGEGRAVFDSPTVVRKLRAAAGQDLDAIRGKVYVDVIGRANIGADIMIEGEIPDKAWRAMSAIRPFMTQRAKDQSYQICVRPFSTETHDAVALVMLYDRKQCELAAV